jgi:hypothetical protein
MKILFFIIIIVVLEGETLAFSKHELGSLFIVSESILLIWFNNSLDLGILLAIDLPQFPFCIFTRKLQI